MIFRAFTLLETLVYMALLSLILTGLIVSTAYLHDSVAATYNVAKTLLQDLNSRDATSAGEHSI